VLRGSFNRQSMILSQFPSEDAYGGFREDPDYQPIKNLREDNMMSVHMAFPVGSNAV